MARANAFATAIWLIIVARVLLISNTEIVGAMYDTEGLAWLTVDGFWNRPSDAMRPPVVPLIAELVMHLGIPWRMFLEAAFLTAAVALSKRLKHLFGPAIAVVALIAIAFNPYTLRSFNEFQREPLLLVFYLGWAWSILGIFARTRWSIPAFGVFAALIVFTREGEELFVAGGFVLVAAGVWVTKGRLVGLLVPVGAMLLATLAIAQLNYNAWGIWNYRALVPSYQALLSQLHRIDVDDSVQFAPATRKSFAAALQVSPTFVEFGSASILDDEAATPGIRTWRTHSSEIVGRREIDPTRTLWLMAEMANAAYGLDDRLKSAKVTAAAAEIKAALDSGKLPANSPALPYPFDPNFENWVGDLPLGMLHNLRMMLVPRPQEAGYYGNPDFNPDLFNRALNRRSSLVTLQYDGIQNPIREFIVANYWMLLVVLLLSALVSGGITSVGLTTASGLWGLVIISGIMAGRFVVYSVMSVSVLPVDRYQVFLSPVAGSLLCIIIYVAAVVTRRAFYHRSVLRPDQISHAHTSN